MKISFMNAIARVCDLSGANVEEVAYGMGLDSRIGKKFLNAGLGFGGFCFPKDLSAFIHICENLGYDFRLLKAVQEINETQVDYFIHRLEEKIWNVRGKTIAVWGLSFKPNTDDMRYAPSIKVIEYLKAHGAKVKVYDPKAMLKAKAVLPAIQYTKDALEACRNADCLLVLTEWNEFKEVDLSQVKKRLKHPVVVDGRNIYDSDEMKRLGFKYVSIGRRGI